ncbi:MAG: DUF3343 domain-containing protein [Anaerolineae bacterium]
MSPSRHAIILVVSSSHAIRAEHLLRQAGLETKLMPVPRTLSSDCGICVRILASDVPEAETALEKQRVPYEKIVPM